MTVWRRTSSRYLVVVYTLYPLLPHLMLGEWPDESRMWPYVVQAPPLSVVSGIGIPVGIRFSDWDVTPWAGTVAACIFTIAVVPRFGATAEGETSNRYMIICFRSSRRREYKV